MYVWIVLIFTLIREKFQRRTFCPAAAQINQIRIISVSVASYFLVQWEILSGRAKPEMLKYAVIFKWCSAPKDLKMALQRNVCVSSGQIPMLKSFLFVMLSACNFTDDLVADGGQTFTTRFLKSKRSPGAEQNMKLPKFQDRNLTPNTYTCNAFGMSELLCKKTEQS